MALDEFEEEGLRIYTELEQLLDHEWFFSPESEFNNKEFKEFFLNFIDPNTRTHDGVLSLFAHFFNKKIYRDNYGKTEYEPVKQLLKLQKETRTWLMSRGYRYGTVTAQEATLQCFSVPDDECKDEPYMPVGLVMGDIMTLEEAKKARELEKMFTGFFAEAFFDFPIKNKSYGFNFNLEELDENGRTKQDPRLIDKDFKFIEIYKKTDKFPYRRD